MSSYLDCLGKAIQATNKFKGEHFPELISKGRCTMNENKRKIARKKRKRK